MSQDIIEVKNLQKIYTSRRGETHAVRGINFAVKRGEVFGILGVNGAGKSTTLNILMGLLSASGGSVKIFSKDFFRFEEEIKSRMNIATAYADLANTLSVEENLKVFALMYGVKDSRAKIGGLLEQLEIKHLLKERFYNLSAGQKTRVNLCKSLINDPEILLLDEPTASLDPSIAAKVRSLLLNLQRERHMSILFTSHNMPEVEQMCDRVALLHQGQIYKIDTPGNLQKFLEVPSMEEVFLKLAEGELDE